MSGFNFSELLPFYLDETDEHIAALNAALLQLEQDPADSKALAEAFRMFHSIKGASVVMGFEPVNRLAHHLESLFDQLRTKKRTLDRSILDLTFRCLDELRDYHRDLRALGSSDVDLSGLTVRVVEALEADLASTRIEEPSSGPPPSPSAPAGADTAAVPPADFSVAEPSPPRESGRREFKPADLHEPLSAIQVTAVFEPRLPLPDMKARLVFNRLSKAGKVVATLPPIEHLEELESLTEFVVWLVTDSQPDELRELADVDGVIEIRVEPASPMPRADEEVSVQGFTPRSVPCPSEPEPSGELATARSDSNQLDSHGDVGVIPPPPPPAVPSAKPVVVAPVPSSSPREPRKAKVAETIRVESDRLDYLMNLAGELVINKARFVDIAKGLDELFRGSAAQALATDTEERLESLTRGLENLAGSKAGWSDGSLERWAGHIRRLRDNFGEIEEELQRIRRGREQLKALTEAIHNLGRVTDGLQKGVLDTRMVPIGPLFERFRRVIRDLSLASGKEVVLEITGEKTELDKRMIDELSDPLIHMVRNAVDHGLETPEIRERLGKRRAGTVALQASHRGNSVVITVSDDGRGINCERIRRKVVDKGLMSKSEADSLSDRELIAYIWHPGLSTAETVTEISGRGVGMDIVKNRIENLSGSVDVRSTIGQGTTFIIRLPLTLAIMSSLLVRIFEETYAIPLDHIDEIVEVPARSIFRVQKRPTIEIRKRIVPLVSLGDLFHWGGCINPMTSNGSHGDQGQRPQIHWLEERADPLLVVIVQNGETTIGLVVDQLIGMQEVVLKSLEKNYRAVPGLSGASILGDGRVSLILDIDALISMAAGRYVEI